MIRSKTGQLLFGQCLAGQDSLKHALVTGGTGGIGSGVVRKLHDAGWAILATGFDAAEIAEFTQRHPQLTNCRTMQLDVRSDQSVERVIGACARIDGLVNCAGIIDRDREYELDVFQRVIEVNLIGTMRVCVAAHPRLQGTCGAIVNIASMLSYFGGPLVPAYSASKGGVAQLSKSLAAKWAADGIRVNAVAPGWIETKMTDPLRNDPERSGNILRRTPLGRWGQTDEVGAMVAWLLSDEARFVTGALLPVDGGYSAI